MPDAALGKYFVVRANTVCAEATGASSRYHDTFEEARTEAETMSKRATQEKFGIARILTVVEQSLQTKMESLPE